MKISMPHWVTLMVSAIGVCAGALAPVFPNWASVLSVVAGICAGLAAPTLTPAKEPGQ